MNLRFVCPGPLACVFLGVLGCDTLMTETPPAGDDFESPFDGMSHDLNLAFAAGDENFERFFTVEEGLGPIFNNVGCEGCHPGDGRGTPDLGFFRFSQGGDLALGLGGAQHQDKAIPGIPLETIPAGVDSSFRMPPPVFGVGLIEAIHPDTIEALEARQNADTGTAEDDGITGRINWVTAPDFVPESHVGGGAGPQLGRFSRKAQVSSLLQQVAEAYQQDIGITSPFIPAENPHPQAGGVAIGDNVPDPEIPASTVLETVLYVRLLAPPARGEETAEVLRGEAIFAEIGCATCHIPTLETGASPVPQLSNQNADLYSDLLLHDMGDGSNGLADNRPDGDASGREWRTAPLWGTRIVADFLGGQAFYLHDGRAQTLEEAIRYHGGDGSEARPSKEEFDKLPAGEKQALIAFLESL